MTDRSDPPGELVRCTVDVQALGQALESLINGLHSAAERYEVGRDAEDWDHGRKSAMYALESVGELITSLPELLNLPGLEGARLAKPLQELFVALRQADKGQRSPMLERRRVRHRPTDTDMVQTLKGSAAATVTLLMRAGVPKREAENRVAHALIQEGCRPTGGAHHTLSPNTIAAWRNKMIGHADQTRMSMAYTTFLTCIAAEPVPPEAEVNRQCDLCARVLRGYLEECDSETGRYSIANEITCRYPAEAAASRLYRTQDRTHDQGPHRVNTRTSAETRLRSGASGRVVWEPYSNRCYEFSARSWIGPRWRPRAGIFTTPCCGP